MENNNTNLVFIVDDDQIYSSMAANRLSNIENLEIKTYHTGESMLNDISVTPDLIVLDYNLNSNEINAMDGKSVMQTLLDKGLKIPIILLSGQKDISTAVDLLKFNASDYISKGNNDLNRLQSSVEKIIYLKEINNKLDSNNQKNEKLKKRMILCCSLFLLVILTIYFF